MNDRQYEELLENFAARLNADELQTGRATNPSLSAARIVAYAKRGSALYDLRIEREIRENSLARQIYSKVLANFSIATSNMAQAAADGRIMQRQIQASKLELVEDDNNVYLIVRLGRSKTNCPKFLEVRDPTGKGGRVPLAEPISDVIQLQLDLNDESVREIYALLTQPNSSVHLLA